MNAATKERIAQADQGAKRCLRALGELLPNQGLDPAFTKTVLSALDVNISLIGHIAVLGVKQDAMNLKTGEMEGGE